MHRELYKAFHCMLYFCVCLCSITLDLIWSINMLTKPLSWFNIRFCLKHYFYTLADGAEIYSLQLDTVALQHKPQRKHDTNRNIGHCSSLQYCSECQEEATVLLLHEIVLFHSRHSCLFTAKQLEYDIKEIALYMQCQLLVLLSGVERC